MNKHIHFAGPKVVAIHDINISQSISNRFLKR